ncbi:MAG: Hsp20/alpha crystallin family protein [Chloroflexi bacterium]|nr:Hsp20/alpha crystallin family protein [Chloroflexota bacterium]
MSTLIRWQPFGDLVSLRDAMDRLFEDSFVQPHLGWIAPTVAANLALDMYETSGNGVVKAALPGVSPDQVQVTITGNTLTISGETKEENEVKEASYLRKESRQGSFTRSVTLPAGLEADKADATFENGVLTLKIPKADQVRPKTIKVKAS